MGHLMGASTQEVIIGRLTGVEPLAPHPDWLCWKDLVEDVLELNATSVNQYNALFEKFPHTLDTEVDELCSVLAQLLQTSRYTIGTASDGLPCLDVLQTNRQIPARPLDLLYAVHHRLTVAML